jgi:hydrogenase expression/formation protein HypC
MCQARPGQVIRAEGDQGIVLLDGQERAVSLVAVPGVVVGDYVICHAGFALERVDPAEAAEILAALAELDQLGDALPDREALG